MASDLLVALGAATPDGLTLFAHNNNRPRGERAALTLLPGCDHAPGDSAHGVCVPEVRHTWAALVGHARGAEDECFHGVNEKGVAIGCTSIATRVQGDGRLTGPELVRLGLQRAASARQAVEVVTDLIARHGQGGTTPDAALLIADAREAYAIEAAGSHWALAQVGRVRAVSPVCMIRQDWDRLSRGLSDLAISRGWWPEDGCKLDFAGAVGRVGPDHVAALRRWGKATMTLEQHSGQIDVMLMRRLLRELSEASDVPTASSFVVRLGPEPGDLPAAWCAFGAPTHSVFLPAFPCADLPEAYDRIATELASSSDEGRPTLKADLADLQERIDEQAHDFIDEARTLRRRGEGETLRRLAGSFMQHAAERVEDALGVRVGRGKVAEEVLQGADF